MDELECQALKIMQIEGIMVILVLLLVLLTLVEEVVVRSTEQKVVIQANLAVLVEVVLKNVLLELE